MIAELSQNRFEVPVLDRKLSYHQSKIDDGKGELLYSSLACDSLKSFKEVSELVVSRNDRVELPYHEVSLNFPVREKLSDEKLKEIGIDYMDKYGAGDSSFIIVRHDDKEHQHVHILFTSVDIYGKWISNYNERIRSQLISRELEQKYELKETQYRDKGRFSLSESKAREYYFHNALCKGLRSYNTRNTIENMLSSVKIDLSEITSNPQSNLYYELVLGDNRFKEVGAYLTEKYLFKSLYKDELLDKLDSIYAVSSSMASFRNGLEKEGIYMRMLTDKGSSKYVYGLANVPIYFNDKSLPMKYRYGILQFEDNLRMKIGNVKTIDKYLPVDEQKYIIYNSCFLAFDKCQDYDSYKLALLDSGVELVEHRNGRGVYGLSLKLANIEGAVAFKASDISRKLGYNSIQNYFNSETNSLSRANNATSINRIAGDDFVLNDMKQATSEFMDMLPSWVVMNREDDLSLLSSRKRRIKGMFRNR